MQKKSKKQDTFLNELYNFMLKTISMCHYNLVAELFTDLNYRSKMINFDSILTTFELCIFLEADVAVVYIGSILKPNRHNQIVDPGRHR